MKHDLTIIVPSIRCENLEKIYFMLENAIQPYSWEMIVVSPYQQNVLVNKGNVKWIRDFGSPSRCVQMGALLAEGRYMCWLSDDCTFLTPMSLSNCISLLETKPEKDAVTLRYFEGDGNGEFPLDYWRGKHHGDMKVLPGIPEEYRIAPLGMYNTNYFRKIGGLDCRYEHINMCTHDLAFRVQNDGGVIHNSPETVARFYWSWHHSESVPVQRAYFETDNPLFQSEYSQDQSKRILIDYNNWMVASSVWKKRFE